MGFAPDTAPSSPVSSEFLLSFRNASGKLSTSALDSNEDSYEFISQQFPLLALPSLPKEVHTTLKSPLTAAQNVTSLSRPKSAIRASSYRAAPESDVEQMCHAPLDYPSHLKLLSESKALETAENMAQAAVRQYGSRSAPGSRRNSFTLHDLELSRRSYAPKGHERPEDHVIDLEAMTEPESEDDGKEEIQSYQLRRWHCKPVDYFGSNANVGGSPSRQRTPMYIQDATEDSVSRPHNYRPGVLSSLLRINNFHRSPWSHSAASGSSRSHSRCSTAVASPGYETSTSQHSSPTPGRSTPISSDGLLRHFPYLNNKWNSSIHIEPLGLDPVTPSRSTHFGHELARRLQQQKQKQEKKTRRAKTTSRVGKRSRNVRALSTVLQRLRRPNSVLNQEAEIDDETSEVLQRQRFIATLCRAFMAYGAPNHRVEEYMDLIKRALRVDCQLVMLPGCMIVVFTDAVAHTSEVKLIQTGQGMNFRKLRATHLIYRQVITEDFSVWEANEMLDELVKSKELYGPWTLVLIYGLASATVAPFAYDAAWADLPMCFLLGSLVGFLQNILMTAMGNHTAVFEMVSIIIVSFVARLLGSIRNPDGSGQLIFCFSAMAQSGVALILPGYTVFCAALELQSYNILSGSVRVVYATLYCFFMSFAMGIGTTLAGMLNSNVTSNLACRGSIPEAWDLPFVVLFCMTLIVANQGEFKHMPFMVYLAISAYIINTSTKLWLFRGHGEFSAVLGAGWIGFMANAYVRWGKRLEKFFMRRFSSVGRPILQLFLLRADSNFNRILKMENDHRRTATAVMLPAIWLQVPSAIAGYATLVSGATTADETNNRTAAGFDGSQGMGPGPQPEPFIWLQHVDCLRNCWAHDWVDSGVDGSVSYGAAQLASQYMNVARIDFGLRISLCRHCGGVLLLDLYRMGSRFQRACLKSFASLLILAGFWMGMEKETQKA